MRLKKMAVFVGGYWDTQYLAGVTDTWGRYGKFRDITIRVAMECV